ncbi:MAG: DUF1648 domain-containing protein [Bacillota bacterium]
MNNITLVLIVLLVPMFIFFIFVPYLTRKTESFGVSIPETVYYTPELKKMRKQYAYAISFLSAFATGIFLITDMITDLEESAVGILLAIVISVFILLSFLSYYVFHIKMKQLKKLSNWKQEKSQKVYIHTQFHQSKLRYSNAWFLFSIIIAIATIIASMMSYAKFPEQIPMQYNFQGEVTNWAEKSHRTVLAMPIIQLYLTLIFVLVNTIIGKAKQQINAENPNESMQQNILFRRRWSAFTIIGGILLTILFSIVQFSFMYPIPQALMIRAAILISIGLTIGAIILSITTGQGGSRIKASSKGQVEVIDKDDDRYWKLGQFYVNKNDPTIFLEKRFGIGWTMNWGRPLSWVIVILFVLITIGIVWLAI